VGGKHGLGGIAGYDAKETADENPDRLAVVQRLTTAYMLSTLNDNPVLWNSACGALSRHASDLARIESKF
jgi:hypothetical protein